jgi:hypothetical protein
MTDFDITTLPRCVREEIPSRDTPTPKTAWKELVDWACFLFFAGAVFAACFS